MEITVTNYRGVRRAALAAAPIALLTGRNEAGKTSTIQAIQAALTRTPIVVDGVLKKTADVLVHDGDTTARVEIRHQEGSVRLEWPKCTIQEAGDAPPHASTVAAGLESLATTAPKERARLLTGYIDADPSITDLAMAMSAAGFGEKTIDATWTLIEREGWDGAHAKTREQATKLKGQWEAVTGEEYGRRKAEDWLPATWEDDLEEASDEALADEVASAERAVAAAIGTGAIAANERARLEELAGKRDPLATSLKEKRAAVARLEKDAAAKSKALEAMPVLGDVAGIPCPHCGGKIAVRQKGHELLVEKADDTPEAERRRLREQRKAAADALATVETKLAFARNEVVDLEKRLAEVEDAAKRLAQMPGDAGEVRAEADARLNRARRRLDAFRARVHADALHRKVVNHLALADILKPDGLRRQKLTDALDGFNATLKSLTDAAGWPVIQVTQALNVMADGRGYALLSESAQFRVRVVLQVAMARMDGSATVVIDGADVLDQRGRNGLLKLLKAAEIAAVIGMTFNKPELVPNLARAGRGRSYWIEAGTTQEIGA